MNADEQRHFYGKLRRHHNKTGLRMIQSGALHRDFDEMVKRLKRDGVLRKEDDHQT